MELEQKITFFLELLGSCQELWYWQFDKDFKLLYTTCPYSGAFERVIFGDSKRREQMLSYAKSTYAPLLSTASVFSLEWGSIFEMEEGELEHIHVLGPYFSTDTSKQTLESTLDKYYMQASFRRRLVDQLSSVAVLPFTRYIPYLQMLYHCISGERLYPSKLQFEKIGGKREMTYELLDEKNPHTGVFPAEQELFSMITEGNVNYAHAFNKVMSIATGGNRYTNSRDSRNAIAVKFITLSTRAAIKGGLSPSVAYALGDRYESAAIESKNIAEAKQILDTMFDDFVHRVHRLQKNSSLSKPIQACCDYISLHIHEKIDLDAMTESIWYTKYYLTRKFKQEMGMSIWDYINQQKVERAKHLLADPANSIQDIADKLSYCSRSYFSETFKQHTGMWPSDYRARGTDA